MDNLTSYCIFQTGLCQWLFPLTSSPFGGISKDLWWWSLKAKSIWITGLGSDFPDLYGRLLYLSHDKSTHGNSSPQSFLLYREPYLRIIYFHHEGDLATMIYIRNTVYGFIIRSTGMMEQTDIVYNSFHITLTCPITVLTFDTVLILRVQENIFSMHCIKIINCLCFETCNI